LRHHAAACSDDDVSASGLGLSKTILRLPIISHLFKNSHIIPTKPMGIQYSTRNYPIPMPMGIPIPTAYRRLAYVIKMFHSFIHIFTVHCLWGLVFFRTQRRQNLDIIMMAYTYFVETCCQISYLLFIIFLAFRSLRNKPQYNHQHANMPTTLIKSEIPRAAPRLCAYRGQTRHQCPNNHTQSIPDRHSDLYIKPTLGLHVSP